MGRRRVNRLAALAAVVCTAVVPAAASASTASGSALATPQSVTFAHTGQPQVFTVPAGVSQITVTAAGGVGGMEGTDNTSSPGTGAVVTVRLAVTPQEVFNAWVGGAGATNPSGGAGGDASGFAGAGGHGGAGIGSPWGAGGGGGGVSALTTNDPADVLVAAGGGGGAGAYDAFNHLAGGDGGSAGQQAGDGVGRNGASGGTGGGSSTGNGTDGANGVCNLCYASAAGGAGGGGYPAGGTGGQNGGYGGGGGGAGDSFVAGSAMTQSFSSGSSGSGYVTISWFPLVAPTAALSARQTTVALHSAVTLQAQVAVPAGDPAATGTVLFVSQRTGANVAQATLTAANHGVVKVSTTSLPQGVNGIYAAYEGDTIYSPVSTNLVDIAVVQRTVSLSSSSLKFGAVSEGGSETLSETVTVSGPDQVTFTGETLTGSAQFQEAYSTCAGQTWSSGDHCKVWINFNPTQAGAASGTLGIKDNATGAIQKVTLSGTGQ